MKKKTKNVLVALFTTGALAGSGAAIYKLKKK